MALPIYVPLRPGDPPPILGDGAPFIAVVVIDADVTPEWQRSVSD